MSHQNAKFSRFWFPSLLLVLLLLTAACGGEEPVIPANVTTAADAAEVLIDQPTDIPTPMPATLTPLPPTPVPPPPTPTPPLAALVNGEPITLADYQADVQKYVETLTAIGENLPENYQNLRLMALIEQKVINQAAAEWGIVISDDDVTVALNDVISRADASGGYEAWLRANQYDAAEFPNLLRQQMVTSAVIDEVVRSVPTAVEQRRARYIVVDDGALAQSILDQARSGSSFADLAVIHSLDQATAPDGGDLDFIMRGWLFRPEVENVIFAGEINQISDVITVDYGNGQISYYLVQVIEIDPARPLTSAQRDVMTRQVIEEWLGARLASAEIVQFE